MYPLQMATGKMCEVCVAWNLQYVVCLLEFAVTPFHPTPVLSLVFFFSSSRRLVTISSLCDVDTIYSQNNSLPLLSACSQPLRCKLDLVPYLFYLVYETAVRLNASEKRVFGR